MRIRRVRATPVNLRFAAPYRFAYGSTASLTKTIVEVETDDGLIGLGEGADGDTAALIEALGERLTGLDPLDLNECERRCVPAMSFAPWDNFCPSWNGTLARPLSRRLSRRNPPPRQFPRLPQPRPHRRTYSGRTSTG